MQVFFSILRGEDPTAAEAVDKEEMITPEQDPLGDELMQLLSLLTEPGAVTKPTPSGEGSLAQRKATMGNTEHPPKPAQLHTVIRPSSERSPDGMVAMDGISQPVPGIGITPVTVSEPVMEFLSRGTKLMRAFETLATVQGERTEEPNAEAATVEKRYVTILSGEKELRLEVEQLQILLKLYRKKQQIRRKQSAISAEGAPEEIKRGVVPYRTDDIAADHLIMQALLQYFKQERMEGLPSSGYAMSLVYYAYE
jgi:hypothetical protein